MDDTNTCKDATLSTEGAPYNWSCQACEGEWKSFMTTLHFQPTDPKLSLDVI